MSSIVWLASSKVAIGDNVWMSRCKVKGCTTKLKLSRGNTSHVWDHYKSKHPKVWELLEPYQKEDKNLPIQVRHDLEAKLSPLLIAEEDFKGDAVPLKRPAEGGVDLQAKRQTTMISHMVERPTEKKVHEWVFRLIVNLNLPMRAVEEPMLHMFQMALGSKPLGRRGMDNFQDLFYAHTCTKIVSELNSAGSYSITLDGWVNKGKSSD